MRLTCILIYILLCLNARSQAIIQGIVFNSAATELKVFGPYEGRYYNHELPTAIMKLDSGQSFQLLIQVDAPVFIRISFDMVPVYVFAEPGDTVSFVARVFGDGQPRDLNWIEFAGRNATGQEYFNKFFSYPNMTSKFTGLWEQFNGKKTAKKLVADIKQAIVKSMGGFDSLEKRTTVSPAFIRMARNTGQSALLNEALKRLQRKGSLQSRYRGSEITAMIREIFTMLNPLDPSLASGVLSKFYAVGYLLEKERTAKGLIGIDEIYDSVWSPSRATRFKVSASFVPYLFGAKNSQTMYYWGDMLLAIAGLFPESVTNDDLSAYEWRFPKNPYIPKIRRRLNIAQQGDFSASGNSFDYILLDTIQALRSLREMTEFHFKNQVVLVDTWATWCLPCKMEFQQNDSLDRFLRLNQVKKLYISIDHPKALILWKSNIHQFRLQGYHIMAGKELQLDLQARVFGPGSAFSIPRYFIINKKGQIAVADAYRPSQTWKLIDQIRKHLE